ncbi:hypothetical protein [Streptomyces platensis]|uniref:hypothetical protein n=1 Tax=Streptomyces platensis TaxID=58346 RepID=UPI001F304A13|nr:hypothetical protein [Streptomyces platensis]
MSYSPQPAPSGQQLRPLVPLPLVPLPAARPPVPQPPVNRHSGLKIAVGAGCALVVLGLGVTVGGGKQDGARPAPTVRGTVTAEPTAPPEVRPASP